MYFLDILWCVVWLLWLFQPRNHLLCNLLLMSRLFYSFIQLIYTFDIFLSSRPNENDLEAPFFFVFKFNFKNSIKSSVRVLATTLEMLSKACFDVLKNKEALFRSSMYLILNYLWDFFEILSRSLEFFTLSLRWIYLLLNFFPFVDFE